MALALQRHGGADLERFATGGASKDKKADKADKSKAAAEGSKETGKEAGADGAAAAEGLQQYVQQLQDAFLSGGGSQGADGEAGEGAGEGAGQQQRQWAVEQLCSVLKQRAAPAAVKLEVLRFLAVHALFSLDAGAAKKVGGRCGRQGGRGLNVLPLGDLGAALSASEPCLAIKVVGCTSEALATLSSPQSIVSLRTCLPRRARMQR